MLPSFGPRRSLTVQNWFNACGWLAISIFVIALCASPASAARRYVRDEIRINMRAGPGNQYKILKVLTSGESVDQVGGVEGWHNIALSTVQQGWVPRGYLVAEAPASVAVPRLQAELDKAGATIAELEQKLATQAESIKEVETLRSENQRLETDFITLSNSSWARAIGTGGLIAFIGIIVGAAWPRGGKSRRLKL